MNLSTILAALPMLTDLIHATGEVRALFDESVAALNPADQATAKAAVADLMSENDEGHARYQANLAEAAKR